MFNWAEIQRRADGKILLLYRHERIFNEGLVRPGMRVLDVGGWGVLARALLEEGAICTILDTFSEDQYYSERVKALPHIVGDILQADQLWGQEQFDVITCFEMLEHCTDQSRGVENMYVLLKPGGVLVGTFPIPGTTHQVDDPSVTFLNREELRDLLTAVGFTVLMIEETGSMTKEAEPSSLYFKARKPGKE